jgi:arylsulfatase A-like enzyme
MGGGERLQHSNKGRETMKRMLPQQLVIAAVGIIAGASCPEALAKPDVIQFIIDDLGYADMGFLAQAPADVKQMKTPGIDRLRAMGTYFSSAYATSPICSPSRTGLITGRYQQRWGNYWYGQGGLPLSEKTLPQALKELGYTTKKIGKCHHNGGPGQFPTKHGFDEFIGFVHHTWDYMRLSEKDVEAYGKGAAKSACIGPLVRATAASGDIESVSYENGFTTEIFTDEAIEFINRDHKGKPYYLQLDYNAMHHPTYVVPPKYARRIGLVTPEWDRDAGERPFPYWNPKREGWGKWHKKWGHLQEVDPDGRRRYLAHLLALDECIGKVLDSLEKQGELSNTIIAFISDNGGTINTYANNGELRGYKYMFGEGGIRVPMIIAWSGKLPTSQTCVPMVSAMDVMPTILDLCGGKNEDNLDGKSLLPLLEGKSKQSTHDYMCWSNGRKTKVVRQGDWKLIIDGGWDHANYTLEGGTAVRADNYKYPSGVCLFNLKDDLGETTNLADKMPDKVEAMTGLYDDWHREMKSEHRIRKNK